MNQTKRPIVHASPKHLVLSAIISVLALTAMLVGLLAQYSAGAGHPSLVIRSAVVAVACAALLALAALVLLAARTSLHARLLATAGRAVRLLREPPSDTLRPSLFVLSISRT